MPGGAINIRDASLTHDELFRVDPEGSKQAPKKSARIYTHTSREYKRECAHLQSVLRDSKNEELEKYFIYAAGSWAKEHSHLCIHAQKVRARTWERVVHARGVRAKKGLGDDDQPEDAAAGAYIGDAAIC